MFISGCYVDHPVRYRVLHQMEQLELAGISCQMVFFDNVELRMEQNYRAFLFFRCECTDEVAEFIDLAKSHGKTVLFDIDDLVTNTIYTDQVPWIQRLTPLNRAYFDCSVVRNGQTLTKCDIAVSTTKTLAELQMVNRLCTILQLQILMILLWLIIKNRVCMITVV